MQLPEVDMAAPVRAPPAASYPIIVQTQAVMPSAGSRKDLYEVQLQSPQASVTALGQQMNLSATADR